MAIVKGKMRPWLGLVPAGILLFSVGGVTAVDLSTPKCVKEAIPGTVFVTLGPQVKAPSYHVLWQYF